jgi:hypothetical protein
MRETSTKFGLHAGNMKFDTQNEEQGWCKGRVNRAVGRETNL